MINELKNITQEELYKMINEDGNNEIKDWLAKLGKERIDEIFDPEIALQRALDTWRKQGYTEKEISKMLNDILKKTYKIRHYNKKI